jgi:hypothetical protein
VELFLSLFTKQSLALPKLAHNHPYEYMEQLLSLIHPAANGRASRQLKIVVIYRSK